MTNSVLRYSSRTAWIHWVSALLIIGLIYTGINMEHGAHDVKKFTLYKIHFALGFSVFILTIWRVIARFRDERPQPLYANGSIHQKFISIVHNGFYLVILWMCISGISSLFLEGIMPSLISGNFLDLPEISSDGFHPIMLSHHIVAKILFLLLLFHILGFVVHLLRKRENTLNRIWLR